MFRMVGIPLVLEQMNTCIYVYSGDYGLLESVDTNGNMKLYVLKSDQFH